MEIFNIGAEPDDGAGDNARIVGTKLNVNFAELQAALNQKAPLASPTFTGTSNFGGAVVVNTGLRLGHFNGSRQVDNPGDNTAARNLDLDCSGVTSLGAAVRFWRGTNTSGSRTVTFFRGDGSVTADHQISSGSAGQIAQFCRNGGNFTIGAITSPTFTLQVDGTIGPHTDNTRNLGSGSLRFATVFAGTGTINTSDAREKTPIRPLDEAELLAAQRLAREVGAYQWLASIEEKGARGARMHIGLTVQRAIEIMEDEGLDPWRYGFICRDEVTRRVKETRTRLVEKIEEVEEAFLAIDLRDGVPVMAERTRIVEVPVTVSRAVVDEAGQQVLADGEPLFCDVPVMVEEEYEVEIDEPAGERLGFRYDQLALFILRGQEARLAALEA